MLLRQYLLQFLLLLGARTNSKKRAAIELCAVAVWFEKPQNYTPKTAVVVLFFELFTKRCSCGCGTSAVA